MNAPYFVDWSDELTDAYSLLWAVSLRQEAVTWARDSIRRLLATDPHKYGTRVSEGLFKLHLPPLVVYFSIDTPNSRVTITDVFETA